MAFTNSFFMYANRQFQIKKKDLKNCPYWALNPIGNQMTILVVLLLVLILFIYFMLIKVSLFLLNLSR